MNLYRVEAILTASYTDWESPNWLTLRDFHFNLRQFPVIKETPKGKWINEYGRKRWVGNDTLRRFAHPTVPEAYAAFLARKKKQRRILKSQLRDCEAQINMAETAIANDRYAEPSTNSLY